MNAIKPGMVNFGCLRPYLHKKLPMIRCVSDTHKFPLLPSLTIMSYLLVTFSDMSSNFGLFMNVLKMTQATHTHILFVRLFTASYI